MAHADICPCLHGNYVCLLPCRECFPDAAEASEDDIRAEFHRMAAAPAVEGWVWCLFGAVNGTHEARPLRKSHEGGYVSDGPCPGPHRTLHIGEVKP